MWINAVARCAEEPRLCIECVLAGYGWPRFSVEITPLPAPGGLAFVEHWRWQAAAVNVGIALSLLGVVMVSNEVFVRRLSRAQRFIPR